MIRGFEHFYHLRSDALVLVLFSVVNCFCSDRSLRTTSFDIHSLRLASDALDILFSVVNCFGSDRSLRTTSLEICSLSFARKATIESLTFSRRFDGLRLLFFG